MVITERIRSQYFVDDNEQSFIRIAQQSGPVKPKRNGLPWSADEHDRFLSALERYPSGPWKVIASYVGTRTTRQTMTHAQKYREEIARRKRSTSRHAALPASTAPRPLSQAQVAPVSPELLEQQVLDAFGGNRSDSAVDVSPPHPSSPPINAATGGLDLELSCSEIDEMFYATLLSLVNGMGTSRSKCQRISGSVYFGTT